jgi:hypothetical protein
MRIPGNFFWKVYVFLFAWNALGMFFSVLYPGSEIFTFYHIISAFDPRFSHISLLATASALINLSAVIAVFGYAFDRPCAWQNFWKLMLIARLAGDILGRNYELAFFKSTLAVDKTAGVAALALSALFLLPAYIAHYRWAVKTSCDK